MPQSSLRSDGWQIADPDTLALMDKLRGIGTQLREYVQGKMHYGIKTGFNDAFVIDKNTRDHLVTADQKSLEVIRPWLRGEDVKRWQTNWQNLYVIFIPRGTDINQYPAIRDYLVQFKGRLTPGIPGGRKAGSYEWYEIQDNVAYYAEFLKPKIIYPHFNLVPNFTFDNAGYFSVNKTYIIPIDDMMLLGVLNSSCVNFFLQSITSTMRGGYMELTTQVVEQIPIPNTTSELCAEIEGIVRELLVLHGQGEQVAALETELNWRVYQAYRLTDAEIRLIESKSTGS